MNAEPVKHGVTDIRRAARLSVAPMMDWTDRHCRFLHRQFSACTLLYTEMVTAPALVRGGALHLLDHDAREHPVALQLGGSEPAELAEATAMGVDAGYPEINLNCGCPSDRVKSGLFGAVLMADPVRVAACVAAMGQAAGAQAEITVKCRIGIDDQDPERILPAFLEHVAGAGVTRVIIHARKAWLQGLSPKENRDIPPLDYDLVLRMKDRFPDMHLSINGGVTSLAQAQGFLERGLDGVMIGRTAYHDPASVLAQADPAIYGQGKATEPDDVVAAMRPYIAAHLEQGGKLHQISRHMLGLFTGRPGARIWRRHLSEGAHRPGAGLDVIDTAQEARTAADTAMAETG